MKYFVKLKSTRIVACVEALKDAKARPSALKNILLRIGEKVGHRIGSTLYGAGWIAKTNPQECSPVIFTTKGDMEHFGLGLKNSFGGCHLGYMDFGGRRGLSALNAPVREMVMPNLGDRRVDVLIIGKAVLATGCTAITLAKTALLHFVPGRLVIATIFYSKDGLIEVRRAFPNSVVFAVGEPVLEERSNFLIPGIGVLENRLKNNNSRL